MANTFKTIAPFLHAGQSKASKFLSYAGLGIGVLLLLTSLQLFLDINQLLKNKNPRKNGYDFISVTKMVTDQSMGNNNRFTEADIIDLKTQPFIKDAAPLLSNQFRVKASAGKLIPFSTDLFLESVKNDFLDTVPPSFTWKMGDQNIPIIFSADFLEMYNVFAPAYELPQLSENTIGLINVTLEFYGPNGIENYTGRIVGLSDRINSVLVPENFLQWANQRLGDSAQSGPGRVFIQTTDANSTALLNYLQEKNYHVNKDRTKFGRVKQVLQVVVTGLAGFAILVILLAMMLFSFYLQLMIARSKDNLQLLITLGYSPRWLSRTVAKRWVGGYAFIIFLALVLTAIIQFAFHTFSITGRDELSPFISNSVILLAIVLLLLCVAVNYRLVNKLLKRL